MKKYVSILELYNQIGTGGKIADTLFMQFKGSPSNHRTYDISSFITSTFRRTGIFSISENSEEIDAEIAAENSEENAMESVAAGTRLMTAEHSVSGVFNTQFNECEIPYFLEMEFLKQRLPVSEGQGIPWFTGRELDLLEQMFMLSLIIYINDTGDTRTVPANGGMSGMQMTDIILEGNLIMPILESKNLIHEMPTDSVSETMKSIYMECFGQPADGTKAKPTAVPNGKPLLLEKTLNRMGQAADLFSYSAQQFYCDFQLFAPWVLVFLLLELETGKLDKLEYNGYKNYMEVFERYVERPSYIGNDCFSYGMRNGMHNASDDIVFYNKVHKYVENKMVEAVSKNLSTISITQRDNLKNWSFAKISIRLDSPELCWEEAENNE